MPATLGYPNALPSDPTSVVAALEKGSAQWARGELREAVRGIHRAADAAEAAGDDRRAVALARVAADLMSSFPSTPSPPRDEGAALAPFDDFNDQTIVDSPAMLAGRQVLQSSVVIEERERAAPFLAFHREETPRSGARKRAALRVAVSHAPSADGALCFHVLDDGSPAPKGTTEALLVMLDPDAILPAQLER